MSRFDLFEQVTDRVNERRQIRNYRFPQHGQRHVEISVGDDVSEPAHFTPGNFGVLRDNVFGNVASGFTDNDEIELCCLDRFAVDAELFEGDPVRVGFNPLYRLEDISQPLGDGPMLHAAPLAKHGHAFPRGAHLASRDQPECQAKPRAVLGVGRERRSRRGDRIQRASRHRCRREPRRARLSQTETANELRTRRGRPGEQPVSIERGLVEGSRSFGPTLAYGRGSVSRLRAHRGASAQLQVNS
jgi:hypothetical protein